ncbi:hypothetical protein L1987_70028 [Smallanthus sonchifolius]|uniref:Uncharacterized protein n=1 Tax=Smallanthus sonchifolius TaxID=185202 RepID=A0ACB9B6H4_9ASTR|nr:hypothetical protein L1987_70028 [Smallanthus sonchifolius]
MDPLLFEKDFTDLLISINDVIQRLWRTFGMCLLFEEWMVAASKDFASAFGLFFVCFALNFFLQVCFL